MKLPQALENILFLDIETVPEATNFRLLSEQAQDLFAAKTAYKRKADDLSAEDYYDRAGIHCRWIGDSAKVLDAMKDSQEGYYEPRDMWTTVPRASVLEEGYATHIVDDAQEGALRGIRIGVIRESMLTFPGVRADEPIANAAAREIKEVLGGMLGATLVESVDPLWPDDPEIEDMSPSYTDALAQLVPVLFPDMLYWLDSDGEPLFPDFAASITPIEFAPGIIHGSGEMSPIDYMVALAEGEVPAEGAEAAAKDGEPAKKDDKSKDGADKKPDEKKPAEKKPAEKK